MIEETDTSIKAIVFDFGGVLFPIEPYSGGATAPEERKEITGTIQAIFHDYQDQLRAHALTIGQFKNEFVRRIKGVSGERIDIVLKSVCDPDPEMLKVIRELDSQFQLFGLVNAPLGWTEIRRGLHRLDRYFKRIVVSHEINIRKPNREIFEHHLKETDCEPTRALFVDDKEENLKAATALGFRVHYFTDVRKFQDEVARLKK